MAPRAGVARLYLGPLPGAPVAKANVAAADKVVPYVSVDAFELAEVGFEQSVIEPTRLR
jgi:hypothetical protein